MRWRLSQVSRQWNLHRNLPKKCDWKYTSSILCIKGSESTSNGHRLTQLSFHQSPSVGVSEYIQRLFDKLTVVEWDDDVWGYFKPFVSQMKISLLREPKKERKGVLVYKLSFHQSLSVGVSEYIQRLLDKLTVVEWDNDVWGYSKPFVLQMKISLLKEPKKERKGVLVYKHASHSSNMKALK